MRLLSPGSMLQGTLDSVSAASSRQKGKCWRDAASQTPDLKSAPASGAAQLPNLSRLSQLPLERLWESSEGPKRSAQETTASAMDELNTVSQPQGSVAVSSRAEPSRHGLTRSHSAPLQSSQQRICSGETVSSYDFPRTGRAPAESDSTPSQPADVQPATAVAKQAELSLHNCSRLGTPNRTGKQIQFSRLSRTRERRTASPPQRSRMQAVGSPAPRSLLKGHQDESALPRGRASTRLGLDAAHEERRAEAQASRHGPRAVPEALQHVFTVCVQSLEGLERLRGHTVAPGDRCHISYTIPGRSLNPRLAQGAHAGGWYICALICCYCLTAHRHAQGVLQSQGDGSC